MVAHPRFLCGAVLFAFSMCSISYAADHAEPFQKIHGHGDAVVEVQFAPDGKTLISSGKDGFVLFWDTKSSKQREALDCTDGNRPPRIGVSRDSKLVATSVPGCHFVMATR